VAAEEDALLMALDDGRRHAEGVEPPLDLDLDFDGSLGGEANPELLPQREPWRTILHRIGQIEQVIGSLLLVVILVLVLAQVAQRYVPGAWPWTGEIARLSMVWATFAMAGYLAAHDRHIAIHVVDYVVRGRALAAVKLFVNVVVLATCVVLLYATYQLVADDIGQVTAAAQLPLRYVNAVPMVGFSLVALRAVLGIVIVDIPGLLGRSEARA
jgi:TRAP-type C4-dicarboxylate transport system permease small subunit